MPHPMRRAPEAPKSAAASPRHLFFAGICFSDVTVDPQTQEVQLPKVQLSTLLHQKLTRRELETVRSECLRVLKTSPLIAVDHGIRRPFAAVLLEHAGLALAGGPREY
jgi:hypothetical protein